MTQPAEIVEQYYLYIESNQLHEVVEFYRPESKMIRVLDGVVTILGNLNDIESHLMTLNLNDINYDTLSCESWHHGFLFAVMGFMQTPGFRYKRKFVQSFFLAPDLLNNTYFIQNDVFCFIGETPGISTSSSEGPADGNGHLSPRSVGEIVLFPGNDVRNQPVGMETDDSQNITSDSSGDNFQNLLAREVRGRPRMDSDKSLDEQHINLDSSTLPSDNDAVDTVLYSFRTFWDALEHINGVPNGEPVKAVHDTPVEEQVVSTENTYIASSEEPQKQTSGDVLKSIPKALQMPSTAIQSSGRPAYDKRMQPALPEAEKSPGIKDESLDQVEDQQQKDLVYVIKVLLPNTVPVKAVDIAPVENPVFSAAKTTPVASTVELLEPKIPPHECTEEAVNSYIVVQSTPRLNRKLEVTEDDEYIEKSSS